MPPKVLLLPRWATRGLGILPGAPTLNVFGVPPPVGVPNTGVGAPFGVTKLALAPENEGLVKYGSTYKQQWAFKMYAYHSTLKVFTNWKLGQVIMTINDN